MTDVEMIVEIIVLIFLLVLNFYIYNKIRKPIVSFLLICIIYMFSIIICVDSIVNWRLPFTPNLQFLFLLIHFILFLNKTFKL